MLSSRLRASCQNQIFTSNPDRSVDSYVKFDLIVVTRNRISFTWKTTGACICELEF